MVLIKTKSFELAAYIKGDPGAAKLAIVIPGRLDTKDYINCTALVDLLADKGFYALAFDPTGTWESPGEIGLYNTTSYLKAVNELTRHFGDRPTLLAGHSRGGAVAVLAGSENKAVMAIVAILASYGPPSPASVEAVQRGYEVELRDLPPGTHKTQKQKRFELPIGYFRDGEKYNAGEALLACTKPKLLFYSQADDFTQPSEVADLFANIPKPKLIHELKTEHDYRRQPQIVKEVGDVVERFLAMIPSEHEIISNIEAYSGEPWGEVLDYDEVREFIFDLRSRPDGVVLELRESPAALPYLYLHGIDYKYDTEGLIEEEFTGKQAYWRALDKAVIREALKDCGSALYINNIHADKTVGISSEMKPRLKLLPKMLEELFAKYGCDCVVLFTHRDTGVSRAVSQLDKQLYGVKSVEYEATNPRAKFNRNHKIDNLRLIVITRLR